MDGMTSSSSTGAVALVLSNLNELAFRSVDSFKRFMYSFQVMQSVDWTTMLLIFWLIFGLFVYTIGNILFIVIKKRKCVINENNCSNDSDNSQDCVNDSFSKTSVNSGVFAEKLHNRQSKLAIATGPDADCVLWVNRIIQWLYSQNDTNIEPILNIWLTALNNKSKKLSIDNGFSIEFVELVREQSFPPELSNVRVDLESNENITATCKVSTPRILLLIKAIRENGSSNEDISQYELHIERFEGMIKVVCITEELLLVVRFMERPDFRGNLKSLKAQQQKSDNRISEDAIIDAIFHTITTTVVDLCLSTYKDFPKFQRNSLHLEGLSHNKKVERKLFVKVVKANSLGRNKGIQDTYCVIEVDEPPQRVQTSTIKETSSPIWNEHFIFNLHENSSEILFELYDKNNNGNDNFLGLGIVSVDELKTNPSQKQIITLQPRPLELDEISGSLTVEFLFMEHSCGTPLSESTSSDVSPISRSPTNAGKATVQTKKKPQQNGDEYTGNDSSLTELEVTEEQSNELYELMLTFNLNHMFGSKQTDETCATQSYTQFGTLSPFSDERQYENNNPFLEKWPNPSVLPPIEFNNKNTNPFLNENKITSFDRSLSCDNISLIMPTIPPLIRRSSIPSLELLPLRSKENQISSDFQSNPFNSLKQYRNKMFYSMPTHSIPNHLNHKRYQLPPTPLFPNGPTYEKIPFFRSLSRNKVNTNPFLEKSPSFSSSISSVIGIESSDSSDNTITNFTAISSDEVFKDNQIVIDTNARHKIDKKISYKKKTNRFNNSAKSRKNGDVKALKSLDPHYDPYYDPNQYSLETTKIGDGMAMHDSFNTKRFGDSDEIELTLTETTLKELENKHLITKTDKNTLSAQRTSENGGSEGYGTGRGTPDDPSITEGSMISSANSNKSDRTSRSRSKEPRSIIRAIRKRFSFNKNRSKSVEIRTDKEIEPTSRDSSVSSISDRARSMPSSREPSSPKDVSGNSISPRGANSKTESFSNLSEISGISTRTFVHEKSTLIVEANDNGELKHYVIPMSLANKSKWRKKGVKLHLFNDHLFVAKHLSGSITCQVCGKLFSRRLGKQGYQCRDCDYMCHKRCHIQVDIRCAKSTISSLKLECVVDPKATKVDKNNTREPNITPTIIVES